MDFDNKKWASQLVEYIDNNPEVIGTDQLNWHGKQLIDMITALPREQSLKWIRGIAENIANMED